jgi:shikimate dehydrogenase
MPYKQAVIPHLDALDPLAARIGAVNTVVNDAGRLEGHNTDCTGAIRALLEEVRCLRGARVLLLGAGGAAKAIAHGLTSEGAVVRIANRDLSKAEALAAEVGARAAPLDETARAGDYDLVVNATSVGMKEVDPSSPIPEPALAPGLVVMDIVYKPIDTALVAAARRRGARVVHGGRMLLHQAAKQFELYTGQVAPLSAMDDALLEQIGGPRAGSSAAGAN